MFILFKESFEFIRSQHFSSGLLEHHFQDPDFYKAAVSCSGNHDNNIYNRGWGECYNGVKEVEKVVKDSLGNETKEYGYKFNVKPNTEIAKNLKGHLMLVTGDMDKNVNPAHTYRMAQAEKQRTRQINHLLRWFLKVI